MIIGHESFENDSGQDRELEMIHDACSLVEQRVMHRRQIDQNTFNQLEREIIKADQCSGSFDVITGHHNNYEAVVLIRKGDLYMAIVENPAFLDTVQAKHAVSVSGNVSGEAS